MISHLIESIGVWYARRELPGWGQLLTRLRLTGPRSRSRWECSDMREIRGKTHGLLMRLDLSNARERDVYYLGRFEELDSELFFRSVVLPGSTFLDVGANIGMVSLLAASLVGATGRVIAVEPNPHACQRIRDLVRLNSLGNVDIIESGLSDEESYRTLKVLDAQSTLGTLAELLPAHGRQVTSTHRVHVQMGDAILRNRTIGRLIVKIDVEGLECNVLRGLSWSIETYRPIVFTEVMSEWLCRAGSSVDELFDVMHGYRYLGLHLSTRRRLLRQHLVLTPVSGSDSLVTLRRKCGQQWRMNVAWVPDEDRAAEVLGELKSRSGA